MSSTLEHAMASLNFSAEKPSPSPFDEPSPFNQPNPFTTPEYLNTAASTKPPPVPTHLLWVLDKKEEILALHSSPEETKIFDRECDGCSQWYKPCMFSLTQKNGGYCRWCQIDLDMINPNDFAIHQHIHCNRSGAKICGLSCTMDPPPLSTPSVAPVVKKGGPAVSKEITLKQVAPAPTVEVVVKKKMSQKQRKAAMRAAGIF